MGHSHMKYLRKLSWKVEVVALIVLPFFLATLGKGLLQAPTTLAINSVNILLVFIGGLLAIISPCAGFLLPIAPYFSTSQTKQKDFALFYAGLILVLAPLVFAGSIFAVLLVDYTKYFYYFAAGFLIIAAILEFKQKTCQTGKNPYIAGIGYGFTSIGCTGPILGAVISLTYSGGISLIYPYFLTLIFALGMMAPLFIFAIFPNTEKWFGTRPHIIKKIRIVILILSAILIIIAGNFSNDIYYKINSWLVEKSLFK